MSVAYHLLDARLSIMVTRNGELEDAESEAREFREQCRRQMERPLVTRMKYGFCRVHSPVLDTPGIRTFESTAAYRAWCTENLPAYLGFQPAPAE